jgi:hypothetical protein
MGINTLKSIFSIFLNDFLGENMAAMQTGTSYRPMPSSVLFIVLMINLVVATKYLLRQDTNNIPR